MFFWYKVKNKVGLGDDDELEHLILALLKRFFYNFQKL